jgi:nicotinate-nucleotide adenylyltransferase
LERVVFLPAGRPPHKPDQRLADDVHRLAMIELSITSAPNFSLSRLDIDRGGYSYTADSLRLLRDAYPSGGETYFLMGQDSLRDFPNWYAPSEIAHLARLGVAVRPGVQVTIADIEARVPEIRGRIQLAPVPLIGVSSRDIRRRVREGLSYRFQVLPAVADYIDAHGLYQPPIDPCVDSPS